MSPAHWNSILCFAQSKHSFLNFISQLLQLVPAITTLFFPFSPLAQVACSSSLVLLHQITQLTQFFYVRINAFTFLLSKALQASVSVSYHVVLQNECLWPISYLSLWMMFISFCKLEQFCHFICSSIWWCCSVFQTDGGSLHVSAQPCLPSFLCVGICLAILRFLILHFQKVSVSHYASESNYSNSSWSLWLKQRRLSLYFLQLKNK